ncbi:NAD(P)H-dependent oxidoreductase [Nocardioides sp. NBC_00850]|uniref:CE1759 family FMN reductase n=1 Tax=Nocardioides sp. NBC_00850 TaxID=2976001 RepID=UPI00386C2079|nr:NAD(P)H-dependent oxidoreductase [Nocardioides sp. NBC_00850]
MSDVTIAVLTAGVSDPSSSRLLADRAAQRTADALGASALSATFRSIDLSTIAVDIAQALVSGMPNRKVTAAIDALAESDAIIASTPVYKAGISGLFKSFADLLDNDLLIAKPVILAATGGTSRHAMVVDEQLRPLFAFLRAIPMPTSLYAAPEDWSSPDLGDRIARAAGELAIFLRNGTGPQIAEHNWGRHRHQFGGTAAGAPQSIDDVDFSTDLMRLAAGGETEQGT